MKKVIALLLVLCMLGAVLIACGKKNPDAKPTEKPTETEQPTDEMGQPALNTTKWYETLDFDGDSLRIMVLNDEKVRYEWETEDPGDDELDQQIALRNEVVESGLNLDVDIVLTQGSATGNSGAWQHGVWATEFTEAIHNDVNNKLHELDAVANFGFDGLNNDLREYYANLLDKDTFKYFNFKLPCWNQDILENGTMNGQLYGMSGDMNLSLFNTALIIWQNDDLYEQARNPEEDPENIQKLLLDGLWTFGELYKWAKWAEAGAEVGSCAGNYGVSIQGDQYSENPTECIPYAWQLDLIGTNPDGTHYYNFKNNDRAEQGLLNLVSLYKAEGNYWRIHGSNQDKTKQCKCGAGGHFVAGGVIFKGDVLYWDKAANRAIREMEDQYSLLCWPKYDENQTDYYTTSQNYFNHISVLDHSGSPTPTKGDAVSAYFQYGTEYSYTYVRGYYFEKIVKLKFFGTDDSTGRVTRSSTIFVMIVDNLSFEFADIYTPALSNVMKSVFKGAYKKAAGGNTPPTLQNEFESNEDEYTAQLAALEQWFGLAQ